MWQPYKKTKDFTKPYKVIYDMGFMLNIKTCEGKIKLDVDPGMDLEELKDIILEKGPKQINK